MKTIVAMAIGALLFGAGLAGGLLLQGLYSGQPQVPAGFERLVVEGFVSRPFTKLGVEFRLRNLGTAGLQIATIMMNGHLNQSITGMSEGWNGTTALSPNQTALLYVYYPCYAQAFNDSIPHLSGSPTQTEMSNMEQWTSSFNCTFTFLTTTAYQYNFTVNRLGFDLYTSLAIWESARTFNFMATEQLKVTNLQFPSGQTSITVQNTGTTPVTITEIHVNNGATNLLATQFTVGANNQTATTVTYTWTNGAQYEVELRSSKGNQFTYTATAPQ
jgi:hypothetical protein